jgi:hypothetical protein
MTMPPSRMMLSLPYGANGWQLCMGLYGIAFGAQLIWPDICGGRVIYGILADFGFGHYIGWLVLLHGVAAVLSLFLLAGRSYWCPMLCSLGALIWTLVGLSQTTMSLARGIVIPVWGVFEILGGIGYSVATVQRARDPVSHVEE